MNDTYQVSKFVMQSLEILGVQCADSGTCHHKCVNPNSGYSDKCFRKETCVPLLISKSWLNDDWSFK